MKTRKKLIEVALPLDAINTASAREKSIRHGHPSTLHLWWARRPLAAARAVIFAQMVDDPSEYVDALRDDKKLLTRAKKELEKRHAEWVVIRDRYEAAATETEVPAPGPEPTLDDTLADLERQRLFDIITRMVQWESTTNEEIMQEARDEIWASWRRTCADNVDHPRAAELFDRHKLPAFHDPFAGGGALPLEAQRLGLEAYASDLNPVAVLINKAMIEIPPRFAGMPPVNPEARANPMLMNKRWKGAEGLAEDVRYYGKWMRDEAEKRIGHLYPKVEITREMVDERPDLKPYLGQKLTVIAWIWARTVKSPNPAFKHVDVPLASTFMLSTKPGKEAYVEPVIEGDSYRFTVKVEKPKDLEGAKNGTKVSRGANFRCIMSGSPIVSGYTYQEANSGRLGTRLMAMVVESKGGRLYLSPVKRHEDAAQMAEPDWQPAIEMPENPRWFSPPLYGLKSFGSIFTPRQLTALSTFADLIRRFNDAADPHQPDTSDLRKFIALYLAFSLSKALDRNTTLCTWEHRMDRMGHTFTRHAIPMTWDFVETNPIAGAGGDIRGTAASISEVVEKLPATNPPGVGHQANATIQSISLNKIVSTDPPYYDNIGYADLSDFFYVWLRKVLRDAYPELLATMSVPKEEELVAIPSRHGNKANAEKFFLDGMTEAMHVLALQGHCGFPCTIYYAFKQSETDTKIGTTNTGWDTFLEAVIQSGFAISGTWPMRTELSNRMIGSGTNALASSIVLVCRKRDDHAPVATRREFVSALKTELPRALALLQRGNIAPVDLAQAAIGPGMAVYTRYSKVLDAEGNPVTVRQALALINQTLDEALAEQEGDFDADSRWALAWFDHSGFAEGDFGVAEILSKAKNTSVQGVVEAGIVQSSRGKVRLLRPEELTTDWDPENDDRVSTWETTHQLIRILLHGGGEMDTAKMVRKLGAKAEVARELCYRLYTVCERKKLSQFGQMYNGLVQSWPEIMRLSQQEEMAPAAPAQRGMFEEDEDE